MLKDLVESKNYLNNLFTDKDFNFINSFNNEISELNSKISSQQDMRDKIVQLISCIADVLNLKDPEIDNYSLYKLSNEVSGIFELINTNINLLSELETKLKLLDSEIVNLLLDIEKATHSEDYYKLNIQKIKSQMDNYSSEAENINEKLAINNDNISTFLANPNTQKYLNGFNITVINNICDNLSEDNFPKDNLAKSSNIVDNSKDNNTLIISEKDSKVFLPYKVEEINDYLEQFPDQYSSFESVVAKEFILPLHYYMSHPVLARFREAYSLCRDREAKPIFESLKYGMDMMFNRRLNPAIIAACKTQDQLSNYLNCLERNDLKSFSDFEIRFEMSPF